MTGAELIDWDRAVTCQELESHVWYAPTDHSRAQLHQLAQDYGSSGSEGFMRHVSLTPHYARIIRYPHNVHAAEIINKATGQVTTHELAAYGLSGLYADKRDYHYITSAQFLEGVAVDGGNARAYITGLDSTAHGAITSSFASIHPRPSISYLPNPRLNITPRERGLTFYTEQRLRADRAAMLMIAASTTGIRTNLSAWQFGNGGTVTVTFRGAGSPVEAFSSNGELTSELLHNTAAAPFVHEDRHIYDDPETVHSILMALQAYLGVKNPGQSLDVHRTFYDAHTATFYRQRDFIGALAINNH